MNRSLQEHLQKIINGYDKNYTEWSADVKLSLLAYNFQITTTLGLPLFEMIFEQKPHKPIIFTTNDEDQFKDPQTLKFSLWNPCRMNFKSRSKTL